MNRSSFPAISHRLAPALLALLAFAPAAKGDDLLDRVLDFAPEPVETGEAHAARNGHSGEIANGTAETNVADAPHAPTGDDGGFAHVREGAAPTAAESVVSLFSQAFPSNDRFKNPATLSLRLGGGHDGGVMSGEYRTPLRESAFDLAFRGFLLVVDLVDLDVDVYGYEEANKSDGGADMHLLWVPLRRNKLEPFFGVGARFVTAEAFYYDGSDEEGSGICLTARLGLKLNLSRIFLTGEYIVGSGVGDFSGTSELIGDLGFYLARRMQMHVFVESIKMDIGSGTAVGGGISFDF